MTPRLLDREAAAAYCGVSANTFAAHVAVAPVAIGSRRLWDVRELDAWIDRLSPAAHSATSDDEWLNRG